MAPKASFFLFLLFFISLSSLSAQPICDHDALLRRKSGNSLIQEPWMDAPMRRYLFSETSQGGKSNGNNRKKKVFQWFLRFSTGILVGSGTGIILCFILKMFVHSAKERQKVGTGLKIFSTKIRNREHLAFLEREEALVSLQVIGRGGCGEVYKAALPGSDGMEIAIKKIIQLPGDLGEIGEENSKLICKKLRQIRSEIRTMGLIRHPNLLPLLAYLPRQSCHYLVFEYMKNGSLQDYLQHDQKELPWLERYRIALGIAKGLEHLHKHSPRIIHRDLKPGNILLDDNMEAKITDFGFAKALLDDNTHASTSNVAGTLGYIAPEYYQTSKFTDKCDVYSFGVLLAVLVTGKFPSDEFFLYTDEISLVRWVRNAMASENPKRVIDSRLLGNGCEEQMLLVLKVACFCTLNDPKERPNSTDVRCMLYQIKH